MTQTGPRKLQIKPLSILIQQLFRRKHNITTEWIDPKYYFRCWLVVVTTGKKGVINCKCIVIFWVIWNCIKCIYQRAVLFQNIPAVSHKLKSVFDFMWHCTDRSVSDMKQLINACQLEILWLEMCINTVLNEKHLFYHVKMSKICVFDQHCI